MTKGKGKSKTLPFLSTGGGAEPAAVVPEADRELLSRFVDAVLDTRMSQMSEERFRGGHPQLYFDLRARFGSFPAALASALKFEVGNRRRRSDLLSVVKEAWDSGESVTLERFVRKDPRTARAILGEFGTLGRALAELGLDPRIAAEDRRWPKEHVFQAVLGLAGEAPDELEEQDLERADRLVSEVIRKVFPSYPAFRKELKEWLAVQPCLYLVWGRQVVTRLLRDRVVLTSRAGGGKMFLGPGRLQDCAVTKPGEKLYCLSTTGMLYPVEGAPFVSGGSLDAKEGLRLSFLGKGEKVAAMLHWSGQDGALAMATSLGRVKLVELSSFSRVRDTGLVVARVAPGDSIAAAAVVGTAWEKLAVVTRKGRGVGLARETVRAASRNSRGNLRLRMEGGDEPAAVVGLGAGQDLVMLGKNGNLLRVAGAAASCRKGRARGIRLSKVPVVAARGVGAGNGLLLATRKGRLLAFREEEVASRGVRCVGVKSLSLDPDDAVEGLDVFGTEDE